jgi:hypothetical protein
MASGVSSFPGAGALLQRAALQLPTPRHQTHRGSRQRPDRRLDDVEHDAAPIDSRLTHLHAVSQEGGRHVVRGAVLPADDRQVQELAGATAVLREQDDGLIATVAVDVADEAEVADKHDAGSCRPALDKGRSLPAAVLEPDLAFRSASPWYVMFFSSARDGAWAAARQAVATAMAANEIKVTGLFIALLH